MRALFFLVLALLSPGLASADCIAVLVDGCKLRALVCVDEATSLNQAVGPAKQKFQAARSCQKSEVAAWSTSCPKTCELRASK